MMPSSLDCSSSYPLGFEDIRTPAFVYDERVIHRLIECAAPLRSGGRCDLLFAIKSFSFAPALSVMATRLDGFAVSSLFEARLARAVTGDMASVHITTPGLRNDELDEIGSLCDHVSFNSLTQWDTHRSRLEERVSCGLRVNPQLSFADDYRYDPCRPNSKLGVPLDDLAAAWRHEPERLRGVRGLLFHSNCDSSDFGELRSTVDRIRGLVPGLLAQVEWLNLGGGYLFEEDDEPCRHLDELCLMMDSLRSELGLRLFMEPGSGLIRGAGYIVTTVLDLFRSGGAEVAVLDTSVNHMPEVFEYGFQPDVEGHEDDAPHEYLLAGCTCLAGDLFGAYRFPQRLRPGDKLVFRNSGSYTLTKANVFNGVALPSVYSLDTSGELALRGRPSYEDFASRWGLGVSTES